MNCEAIQKLLSAYLDGEVTDEERQQVERHIADCDPCRARLIDLEGLDLLLTRLPDVRASAAFGEALRRRVKRPGPVITLFTPRRLSIASAALVLLAVGIVVSATLLGNGRLPDTAYLPNLDLLVDEEYLGIGRYDLDPAVGPGDLPVFDVDREEEDET